MIDKMIAGKIKILILIVAGIIIFLMGYGFGGRSKAAGSSQSKPTASQQTKTEQSKKSALTQKQVKDFLVAYYTKKDLEENRERYRPFMTKAFYTSEVNQENQAVNQAYKGYVVDYVYQSSQIYIDEENKTAIVQVRYTNTLLKKKGDYVKAQTDVVNEATLKLTYSYSQQDGKLLVSKKEQLLLTSNTGTGVSSSYPDYGALREDSESSSSSSEEASQASSQEE